MSYILDALRRAQAERGRGSVPGLHTPATPMAGLPVTEAHPARGLPKVLLLLALVAGLAGAGGWLWHRPVVPAPVVAAPPSPPAPAPPVAAAASPVAAPAAPTPPAPQPPVEPAAAQLDRAEARAQPATRAGQRAADAGAPPAAKAPPARGAPPAPAKPAEAASAPVFAQADLPPAVREQLPTLQLAGVTYSSNPRYRMVIVNGQVLHEGDQAAPGLVLERIEPGRTVWAFRGYRYALPAQ
ncbi:MAG: general secretion pathway protein GspB [Proteobacteria bacterium]|nr:general secretion pathway protein GspB [Pseudomonadota bacterium]